MHSPEPSPRPWHTEQPGDECRFWTIRNPDGISVCTAWRDADAALIVAAVNERDRLRDIVRRMADSLQGIMDAANGKGEGVLDEALLREARAAIVEDKE